MSNVGSDRRNEVEAANKAFASSLQGIASEVGRSLSASDAKAKLVTALQQLEASYQKSFARLSCDYLIRGRRAGFAVAAATLLVLGMAPALLVVGVLLELF